MSLFVDDFYVIASNQKLLDSHYDLLKSTFNDVSRKEGDVAEYLGTSIVKNVDGSILLR